MSDDKECQDEMAQVKLIVKAWRFAKTPIGVLIVGGFIANGSLIAAILGHFGWQRVPSNIQSGNTTTNVTMEPGTNVTVAIAVMQRDLADLQAGRKTFWERREADLAKQEARDKDQDVEIQRRKLK